MAEKKKPEWERGQVLPLAQRPIPYKDAKRPQLGIPGNVMDLANSLGGMASIPGQVASGQMEASPDAALQFMQGMMDAGMGGSSMTGVPKGAMGQFAGVRTEPMRPQAAPPLPLAESALGQMAQTPQGLRRRPSGPALSDAGAREIATLEREADAGIQQKMLEGTWRGLPKKLPNWIKSDADFQLYQRELQQHSQITDQMMKDLHIGAAQAGHKLVPIESVPQFLAEGGT